MSDIGDMIERGSEGPEWVECESNDALRKEIERLRAGLDAAEVQAEHHRTMSLARQDEIGLLRDRIRGNEITISELQIDLGECRRLLREACIGYENAHDYSDDKRLRLIPVFHSWYERADAAAGGGCDG